MNMFLFVLCSLCCEWYLLELCMLVVLLVLVVVVLGVVVMLVMCIECGMLVSVVELIGGDIGISVL